MYAKVGLLSMLLTLPTLKPVASEEPTCEIVGPQRTCLGLSLDLRKQDDCGAHAAGYFKGVVDLGDEIWFSLPPTVTWGQGASIFTQWVATHPEHFSKPAYVCVVKALSEPFPKKEKK